MLCASEAPRCRRTISRRGCMIWANASSPSFVRFCGKIFWKRIGPHPLSEYLRLNLSVRCENRFSLAVHLDLVKDPSDYSLLVDDERGPLDSHVLTAIHRLLFVHAVEPTDLVSHIGKQREIEVVLVGEFCVRLAGIAAYADDLCAGIADRLDIVAEAAGLGSATRGHVLGVKIQHEISRADQVFQLVRVAFTIGQGEGGRFLSFQGDRVSAA